MVGNFDKTCSVVICIMVSGEGTIKFKVMRGPSIQVKDVAHVRVCSSKPICEIGGVGIFEKLWYDFDEDGKVTEDGMIRWHCLVSSIRAIDRNLWRFWELQSTYETLFIELNRFASFLVAFKQKKHWGSSKKCR